MDRIMDTINTPFSLAATVDLSVAVESVLLKDVEGAWSAAEKEKELSFRFIQIGSRFER
jgi:hypothetical protein